MKKLTIIGGGPAGYAAALYASNFDLETTLIESDTLGGTCLNRGCIPAKYWLHVAELNHEIETSSEFGIDVNEKSINWAKTAEKRYEIVNKLVGGIGMLLNSKKVNVIYQGSIESSEFTARPDFLVLDENNIFYVVDAKYSKSIKDKYELQVYCYASILYEIQGTFPKKNYIYLINNEFVLDFIENPLSVK